MSVTNQSFLTGYGVHINGLTKEVVDEHKIDMFQYDIGDCVAVWGEDLTRSLAAVVNLKECIVVWSSPITDESIRQDPEDTGFVYGIMSLIKIVIPAVTIP